MFRKVPFQSSFTYERTIEPEIRCSVKEIDGVRTVVALEFDSASLDLGNASMYDLDNMMKSGVKPGIARPHDVSSVEAVEQLNEFVNSIPQNPTD